MYVVVVGARERKEADDEQAVNALIDNLVRKYSSLVILSTGCDKGPARFVRERCRRAPVIRFVEPATHIYANLPRVHLSRIYDARNAQLMELGDEFHIFISSKRAGSMENLINRCKEQQRDVALYPPGLPLDAFAFSPGTLETVESGEVISKRLEEAEFSPIVGEGDE